MTSIIYLLFSQQTRHQRIIMYSIIGLGPVKVLGKGFPAFLSTEIKTKITKPMN